ncbi:hypothetical protein FRB96_006788 [Tulasnella sp. 330]|nr:hypothetical protein FRB96_006788 [Tulasnella sp. 330]
MVMHPPSAINPDTGLPWNVKTDSSFGYVPTLWVCILFVALFSLTGLVHLYQSFRYKVAKWWIPTVFTCGLVEVIGWSGRIWGSQNVWSQNPYIMQIVCTIFGPSFMTAAFFIIFVRIIRIIGPEYSRLSPKIYTYLFVGTDVTALLIQSIGGAMAATANTPSGSATGAHVMVGGIILQMVAITVYALTSVEYFWRVYKERPLRARQTNESAISMASRSGSPHSGDVEKSEAYGLENLTGNVRKMVLGLIVATVLVYIRSIYRTAELLDGWGGPIITNQTLFDLLDGVPVFLAMEVGLKPGFDALMPSNEPAASGSSQNAASNEKYDKPRTPAYPPSRQDEQPSSFSRIPVSDTRSTAEPLPPHEPREPSPIPSSTFTRSTDATMIQNGSTTEEGTNGSHQPKKKRKLGLANKDKEDAAGTPEVTVDQAAVARANLKAAPIVGVIGYGPGTGGGSGIKRHTPSCDFCKRRKERCSGGPPCQACASRQIPCTFATVNKAHFTRGKFKAGGSQGTEESGTSPADASGENENGTALGADAGPSNSTDDPPIIPGAGEKLPRVYKKRGTVSELACTFCRERRKKCNGERPSCLSCQARGVTCVYPDTPRARKGGRKKKVDTEANGSQASQPSRTDGVLPPIHQMLGMPGMLMPVPFLSPEACHACRGENLPCDRVFPLCVNCHKNSKPCSYDPFTIDPTQLGVWPGPSPIPLAVPPAGSAAGSSSANTPTGGIPPSPGYMSYYDISWMTQWADAHAHAQGQHPLAAMYASAAQQHPPPQPQASGSGSGPDGKAIVAPGPTMMMQPPQFIHPHMLDPTWAAALAQAQAFSFGQGHLPQPPSPVQPSLIPVGEAAAASGATTTSRAVEQEDDQGENDGEVVEVADHDHLQEEEGSEQEQNVEDAEGENEDEDMDLGMDMVDLTQHA